MLLFSLWVGDYLDERIKISILLDYYNSLLTEKQRDIIDLYVNEDLSLKEISEMTKTSRQAIYDIIKRCSKQLNVYEEKLGLMENHFLKVENKETLLDKICKCKKINSQIEKNTILDEIEKFVKDIF